MGQQVTKIAGEVSSAGDGLMMLSWVGALATLAGIASIVITRGAMGMRAIIIGVCLCLLNFVVATYASWILIPVLVATGVISLGWSYVTVKQLLLKNKE